MGEFSSVCGLLLPKYGISYLEGRTRGQIVSLFRRKVSYSLLYTEYRFRE